MRISDYACKYFSSSKFLSNFLSDVRKYSVPTPSEEEDLVTRAKSNDMNAKDELILRNLRFIYSLAKIYSRDENEVIDYVNEGVIGFSKAIERFDVNLGYKFTTFAVWYVRREMNYYLNNTRNIINRSNNSKLGRKIEAVKQKYYAENGRDVNTEEIKELIKEYYGIEVKEDCDVFDVNISSINEEIDDNHTVEEVSEFSMFTATTNEYEETIEKEAKKALVASILSSLPEKYADIMKMLFGIGYDREYSTQEVADKYHMRAIDVLKRRDKAIKYIRQNEDAYKKAL